uniref:DNA-directed RNA polymerase 19 kDa subunit n=1 Tax=Rousettus bat poxvirus TaxID=3141933 RepID=A0AAU7E1T3_9POXV
MEISAELNDFLSNEEFSSYEEESEEEAGEATEECCTDPKSTCARDVDTRVVSKDEIEVPSPQPRQISARITELKRRYTRRLSLYELTGIIAESFNLLQRGRIPLVSDLSDDTFKRNLLHVLVQEIEEGTCPVIIQKNGALLSVRDFDQDALRYHLDYIVAIWKQQRRF